MVNDENLLAALTYATEHPERHNQRWWLTQTKKPTENWCGTAGCIAGITAMQHGWLPASGLTKGDVASLVYKDGVEAGVSEVARDLLGLDAVDADRLFSASNTLRKLWEIAHRLTNERIQIPARFL